MRTQHFLSSPNYYLLLKFHKVVGSTVTIVHPQKRLTYTLVLLTAIGQYSKVLPILIIIITIDLSVKRILLLIKKNLKHNALTPSYTYT